MEMSPPIVLALLESTSVPFPVLVKPAEPASTEAIVAREGNVPAALFTAMTGEGLPVGAPRQAAVC